MSNDLIERLDDLIRTAPAYDTPTVCAARDALAAQAAEIERLTKERDLEKAAAIAAVEEAVALCRERTKLVRRIRNQRVALRQNWEIVEMRQNCIGSAAARMGWALQRNLKLQAEARADALAARVADLEAALGWYGENARLCRLIHSEGDIGRNALAEDGGKRAAAALHPRAPAPADEGGVTPDTCNGPAPSTCGGAA